MMKILVVDDKPENTYLLETLLKGNGYETVPAYNGAEALELALKNRFNLIISDILMPVMDGFTFCRECKNNESLKKIPFVFYTATYTSPKDAEFALSLGADKFILKPQDPDVFIEIIFELLGKMKEKKMQLETVPPKPEQVILKEYNSVLIQKLEDKMTQAEKAEKQLREKNAELQKEIEERKRTEGALQISEGKFRITFEEASVGMCLTDLDGRFTMINNALCSMLGYKKEELLNTHFKDFTYIDDIEPSLNWMGKMISGEMQVIRFEKRFLHKKGNPVFTDINISLIKDSNDRPLFFVTHLVNITDRKLAEEKINILAAIVKSSDDAIISKTLDGIITSWNKGAEKIYGYSESEVIGRDISILALPEYKDEIRQALDKIKIGGHIENYETIRLKKGGEKINVSLTISPIKDAESRIVAVSTIAHDITDRKLTEAALRESEERFRMVFENVFDGISIYMEDPDPNKRKLIACNEQYAIMAGRGRDELLQLGSTQGLQVTLEDTANKNRLESLKRGSTFQGTFSWIRPDGKENIIEYVGRPIKWQGKNHSIGIDRDITEKKLAENEREKMIKELIAAKEKAEKSDKLKTEFLAQISHEIRTPINSIIGCIDLIKDDNIKQLDQDLSDMLKSININGRRIIRTVDLILNASEMQIGTYQSTFTNINLGKKILNVIRSEYSALAEQKGLLFKFQNNLSSSVVYGDSYSIDQIFVNLIDNAVKYTESGKVDVLIDRDEENNIFVSVSDTGVGISEEYLPHIFEPFMQEERGYSRRYEGNGLGLSLVKKYCDLNGIKIKVESKKRIGSKFTITFTN